MATIPNSMMRPMAQKLGGNANVSPCCHTKRSSNPSPLASWTRFIHRRIEIYVSITKNATDSLMQEMVRGHQRSRQPKRCLLAVEPPRFGCIPSLTSIFNHVAGLLPGYTWLPLDDLLEVLDRTDAANRFVGGVVDMQGETVTLVRGNVEQITVPFSYFKKSGTGIDPDFGKLSIDDYGLTVSLGEYEASSDGILYEFDRVYRKRISGQRKAEDKTFGACLRRLRIQRGLSQSDFSPLNAKTIGRIERGEVDKPHGDTMGVIESRLGLSADKIETF